MPKDKSRSNQFKPELEELKPRILQSPKVPLGFEHNPVYKAISGLAKIILSRDQGPKEQRDAPTNTGVPAGGPPFGPPDPSLDVSAVDVVFGGEKRRTRQGDPGGKGVKTDQSGPPTVDIPSEVESRPPRNKAPP